MSERKLHTVYLENEGRSSMEACISESFGWCIQNGVQKIVMFTGTGDGPMYALDNLLTKKEFALVELVAVTPPAGKPYHQDPHDKSSPLVTAGVPEDRREFLREIGIPVISAHFPFKTTSNRGRAPEWNEAAEAFGVLGGGFSLCVQAVLVACDAGAVDAGERVVSMSADTSIVALASRTETFLSAHQGLIVEHIICRPMRYGISKPHHGALDNMGQFGDAAGSRPAQKYIDAVVAGEDPNRLISEIAGTSDDDEGDDLP